MSGICKGSPVEYTNITPDYIQNVQKLMSQIVTQKLQSGQGATPYSGPLSAGLDPALQASMQMMMGMQGNKWSPPSFSGMSPELMRSWGMPNYGQPQSKMNDPRYASYYKYASSPVPMAGGGIVTQPTQALLGEAGPEAVIPLGIPDLMGAPGPKPLTTDWSRPGIPTTAPGALTRPLGPSMPMPAPMPPSMPPMPPSMLPSMPSMPMPPSMTSGFGAQGGFGGGGFPTMVNPALGIPSYGGTPSVASPLGGYATPQGGLNYGMGQPTTALNWGSIQPPQTSWQKVGKVKKKAGQGILPSNFGRYSGSRSKFKF